MTDDPRAAAFEQALQQAIPRIDNYLGNGGLWNPDLVNHDEVLRLLLDLRSLLLKAAPPAEGPTWQPIETAPKGRTVLVFYLNSLGNGRTVRACFYEPGTLQMSDDCNDAAVDVEGYNVAGDWYEEVDADVDGLPPLDVAPTHWMPLPTPPREPGKE